MVPVIRAAQGTYTVFCGGLAGWGRGVCFLRSKTSKMRNEIYFSSVTWIRIILYSSVAVFQLDFLIWSINLALGLCVHIFVWFKIVIFLLKSMQTSWICLEVLMTFPQGVMEKTSHQPRDSPLWVDLTFEIINMPFHSEILNTSWVG